MRICDVPRKEHPLRQVGRSPRDRRHGRGRACRAPRGRRSRRFTRWSDPPREGPRLSRPNWERRHLDGATGPPGILPFIGVAGVSPANGTTGVPPAVKATQNPHAITVRNNHTPRNRPVFCISCLVTIFSSFSAFIFVLRQYNTICLPLYYSPFGSKAT